MPEKQIHALWVRGSRDFQAQYAGLAKGSDEYRSVDNALSILKASVLAGTKIPKDRWPREYVRRYGINNLFKLNLQGGARLTYTVVSEDGSYSVIVLDYFRTHKDYEAFFDY